MGAALSRCLYGEAQQLFERFRVKHDVKFGQGAFGSTYLAYDLHNDGQRVAAKRVSLLDSKLEALQREYDIMRSLEHPNIVAALASCRIEYARRSPRARVERTHYASPATHA